MEPTDGSERRSEEALYAALGERIRLARKHLALTQEELARQVGLTRTSITNLERGRQKIQVHTLYALADALNVRPEELLPSPRRSVHVPLADDMPASLRPAARGWVQRVVQQEEGSRT